MPSLKEACITRLEDWILSGEIKNGQRLPPERDLAASWSISRPVLHEALLDLQAKGMVRIVARHGVFVNDFRTSGSVPMLASIISFKGNTYEPAYVRSLFELRTMLECETARLAALHRTDREAQELIALAESFVPSQAPSRLVEMVFEFNHRIALASENLIYPLIINSFKDVYFNFASIFLDKNPGENSIHWIRNNYHQIASAIQSQDSEGAARLMHDLISTSEKLYQKTP